MNSRRTRRARLRRTGPPNRRGTNIENRTLPSVRSLYINVICFPLRRLPVRNRLSMARRPRTDSAGGPCLDGCEPLAAFSPSCIDNLLAPFCFHARSKAVFLLRAPVMGVKCRLHCFLPRYCRSDQVSGFELFNIAQAFLYFNQI